MADTCPDAEADEKYMHPDKTVIYAFGTMTPSDFQDSFLRLVSRSGVLAVRREQLFNLNKRLSTAPQRSYPELRMPAVDGKTADLDSLGAKYTLVFFWDDREATHKIFNLETLKPIYEQYHSRGLEIYAVSVNPDKSAWAQVVKSQELPWVNVNDGLGTASRSLTLYNVHNVPAILMVSEDGIQTIPVRDRAVRSEVGKALK